MSELTPLIIFQEVLAAVKYYAGAPIRDLDNNELVVMLKTMHDVVQLLENGTFDGLGNPKTKVKMLSLAKIIIKNNTCRLV